MLGESLRYQYRENHKNNKINEIQDLEKEEAEKGLEKCTNIAKLTRIFLAS